MVFAFACVESREKNNERKSIPLFKNTSRIVEVELKSRFELDAIC